MQATRETLGQPFSPVSLSFANSSFHKTFLKTTGYFRGLIEMQSSSICSVTGLFFTYNILQVHHVITHKIVKLTEAKSRMMVASG